MTIRYIVLHPEDTPDFAARVSEELEGLLSVNGTVTRVNPLAHLDLGEVATSPDAALPAAVSAVRDTHADFVIVDAADIPVASFDTLGFNFDMAASTDARILLALDTEGLSPELVTQEIKVFATRAASHEAHLAAAILPAATASTVRSEDVAIVALPLSSDAVTSLNNVELPECVTPLAFQAGLIERARADRKRIVLPEPEDDRVLKAADEILARGIADIIFIGDETTVRNRARELNLDISAASIVSVNNPEYLEKYAVEFARLREKKGITIDEAREKVKDVSYFGTMMVHMGDADGMVSGAAHTTAHTIVPSFQIIKTAPGVSLVSSVFLMLMKDRVWAFGDCAVNPNPTPEQLADIAISSARTAAQFGVEPKVAMLSYSTGTSGSGADVEAVAEAARIAREKAPELPLEGPIQFDAAVDEVVAATKLPDSPVAGRATVFVFPSLNAGNIGYKAVQRSSGAVAVGPVLQGLNKPVNDLSRGALVEDIVNTVALTAIQAHN
ncbi:MAG: phosphate acetyltransferase [Actinobacteria bacterium]|nr:MAG: phosphate acetyltransferase [Actinomycetota bacterium]